MLTAVCGARRTQRTGKLTDTDSAVLAYPGGCGGVGVGFNPMNGLKKKKKRKKQIKEYFFVILKLWCFLCFEVWRSFLVIFDLKFGFSTPKYPYGHVPRSVEVVFDVKTVKNDFLICFFINLIMGLE